MEGFSNKAIQKLGKRLRDGGPTSEDLSKLSMLRRYKFPHLLTVADSISSALVESNIDHVAAGRLKRNKSIIRKLSRPNNRGMDLSRMADLIGLRIIVSDVKTQDKVVDRVAECLPVEKVIDNRKASDPYHRLHLICSTDGGPVEVQVRTLLQHIWANESETFGERVKEGVMSDEIRNYLEELSVAVRTLEWHGMEICNLRLTSELGKARRSLEQKVQTMTSHFEIATRSDSRDYGSRTFIFVHDVDLNQIVSIDEFSRRENNEALDEYDRLTGMLDQNRYDVLTINSAAGGGVRVTHPRLYSVV